MKSPLTPEGQKVGKKVLTGLGIAALIAATVVITINVTGHSATHSSATSTPKASATPTLSASPVGGQICSNHNPFGQTFVVLAPIDQHNTTFKYSKTDSEQTCTATFPTAEYVPDSPIDPVSNPLSSDIYNQMLSFFQQEDATDIGGDGTTVHATTTDGYHVTASATISGKTITTKYVVSTTAPIDSPTSCQTDSRLDPTLLSIVSPEQENFKYSTSGGSATCEIKFAESNWYQAHALTNASATYDVKGFVQSKLANIGTVTNESDGHIDAVTNQKTVLSVDISEKDMAITVSYTATGSN